MGRKAVEGYGGGPRQSVFNVGKLEASSMRHVQTITKTKIGQYDVTIWSSRMESDRALSCFMGPDAELLEMIQSTCAYTNAERLEALRDDLESVPRVTAYAVTDANGNGVVVELR